MYGGSQIEIPRSFFLIEQWVIFFSLNQRRCDSGVYSKSTIYNLKLKKKILNLSNKKLLKTTSYFM